MARSTQKLGATVLTGFTVFDGNTRKTGLVDADFTKYATANGASVTTASVAFTITEVANGRYVASSTSAAAGHLRIEWEHATYQPRGWAEEYDIVTVDGYSQTEALRLILSSTAGKVSGLESNAPVFRDAADTTNRITATTDSNGNRTAMTLNAT